MTLSTEDINSLIETQLALWPEAKANFDKLRGCRRKPLEVGETTLFAQLNPARIRSTAAATDKDSISKRACFLCGENRPKEQLHGELLPGWELLVNPYPILPIHFTIVSKTHRPQSEIPLEMAAMADIAPDLAIFFNGARAGASAPDHMHCQAVLKSELPIVTLVEQHHDHSHPGFMSSEDYGMQLPFHFMSGIITPDAAGAANLMKCTKAFGIDSATGKKDQGLVNAFFWIDGRGYLRVVIIPRRAHRPQCFFNAGNGRLLVSPGALDMAGLLILPVEDDFNRITADYVRRIYSEVAFADALPTSIKAYFTDGCSQA